ncbi:cellobiose dehydrogenase [Fusarium bulbicola]|nr:cellobiose dehydrogenase [Fusarium bulbicola]
MPLLRNVHNRRTTRQRHISPHRILATSLLLPALAIADDEPTSSADQVSEPFVDQVTGLTMERFFGARTSFAFALALPDAASANGTAGSFIGQLQFPLANGEGWGATGLTGDMEGNFILAAWPDGKGGVMASFRQAIDEDNPAEVKGNFKVRPIPDGVSVNETSLLYTFLCENCPEAAVGNAVMGWALSERPPRGDPSNPGAFLGFHERGFGPFTARLAQAKTTGFDAVAAKALDPVRDSGSAVATVPNAFLDGGSDDEDSGDEGAGTGAGVGCGNGGDDDSGDESGDEDDD